MNKLIKTNEKNWLIFFVWLPKSFQDTIAKLRFMMQVNEQQQQWVLLLLVNSNNGVEKPCLAVGTKMVSQSERVVSGTLDFQNCNTFYFVTYFLLKLQ